MPIGPPVIAPISDLPLMSRPSLFNEAQSDYLEVKSCFYLQIFQEVSATQESFRRFGPLVIAGDKLSPQPPTAEALRALILPKVLQFGGNLLLVTVLT